MREKISSLYEKQEITSLRGLWNAIDAAPQGYLKECYSAPFVFSYVKDGQRHTENAAVEYGMNNDEYSLRILVGDKEMRPFQEKVDA